MKQGLHVAYRRIGDFTVKVEDRNGFPAIKVLPDIFGTTYRGFAPDAPLRHWVVTQLHLVF